MPASRLREVAYLVGIRCRLEWRQGTRCTISRVDEFLLDLEPRLSVEERQAILFDHVPDELWAAIAADTRLAFGPRQMELAT